VYNPVSLTGAALAVSVTFAIMLIIVVDATAKVHNPYVGIIGFAILPIPLIIGLLLIPIGMWIQMRRRAADESEGKLLPVVDMNRVDHRRAFITFVTGTIVFLFLTAGGSYKAYEYTETVEFCGETCHEVMGPELTTYLSGPHARVKCVECHVGEGASWYVRSKISGSYQVYSVLFNRYPQPIATPIENLRPARETCERCHWPAKFHGDQMWEVARYRSDEENTRWRIRMAMRTGGSDAERGQVQGIHWHIAQQVEYVPADSTRMEVREVRYHHPDGTVDVYSSMWNPLSEEERSALTEEDVRTMDCMDCHNRPSHQYLSPRWAMDQALELERVPRDLPYIKREGGLLLTTEYESRDEGLAAIESGLRDFYAADYPEVVSTREADLQQAVAGVQEMFNTYFFPHMKARWLAYPNHIGHFEFPGCFRCHDGNMATEDGKVISRDCQLCHVILDQGTGPAGFSETGPEGLEFKHPEDIGEAWREMGCSDCHTGEGY
jgi:nitrate/TMAO reductase-like tetraheme cytochrome c subunit